MLRALKDLESFAVHATDGAIGTVVNFLFDDDRWVVRYLIVETGGFLGGRRVLISPISFGDVDWANRAFHVHATVDEVKHSPSIDTARPVSRQHESELLGYYGYASYWGASGVWGMGAYPQLLMGRTTTPPAPNREPAGGDPNLRSVDEVAGYHVEGTDSAIGHVVDFVVDDASWEIIDVVVATRNWWFAKHVIVPSRYANYIDARTHKLYVRLSRAAIKASPPWHSDHRPAFHA